MIYTLLIGLGGMGKVHFINTRELGMVKIAAAVGSSDADKAASDSFSIPYYGSVEEALSAHPEITVADITTPTFTHADLAMKAIMHGLDVIVEKPVALKKSDAERIFSLAEEKGVRVYPAHVLRYTKEYSYLIDAVHSGRFGAVTDAAFSRMSAWPGWSKDSWLFEKGKSGLVPFDLHIHDLDVMIAAFGKPLSAESHEISGSGIYWKFRYGYGAFNVESEASWLRSPIPFSPSFRILFEHAVLSYDGSRLFLYEEGKEASEIDISYEKTIATGINVPPTGWYYEEMKKIYSLIGQKEKSGISYSDVLKELEILEKL